VALVRERTITTERPPLVGEVNAKLEDKGCCVVSATDPYGRILYFLDPSRYFFFQVAPQLYSRGRVDPVPDPLLLRKCGSAGNRTRTSGSVAKNKVANCCAEGAMFNSFINFIQNKFENCIGGEYSYYRLLGHNAMAPNKNTQPPYLG
jgi:hypothetical protein